MNGEIEYGLRKKGALVADRYRTPSASEGMPALHYPRAFERHLITGSAGALARYPSPTRAPLSPSNFALIAGEGARVPNMRGASADWISSASTLYFLQESKLSIRNKHMCRNIKTLHNFKPPATEAEIRAIIKKHRLPATLYVIEAGDHSFKVPKSIKPQPQVYEEVMDEVARWTSRL